MPETPPSRERALRGIWSAIFFTCVLALVPLTDSATFWGQDIVSNAFRWFFETFRFLPAIAVIVGFALVVRSRIEKGEEYKEDLFIYSAIASLIAFILAVLSFPPVWEHVKKFFP